VRKTFAEIDLENNGNYLKLLAAVSKLSGLFSESSIPFINYRVAENIFCQSFAAENLSRSDIAYDAKINNIGIGIKTFMCSSGHSNEKVAEFNSLATEFVNLDDEELAYTLAQFRNDRINLANRLYNIESSLYHIIARKDKQLVLFDTDYSTIDLNKIRNVEKTKAGIRFKDETNEYSFNRSKSTLYRKFYIPKNAYLKQVELLKDPFELILNLFEEKAELLKEERLVPGTDYVILPLYGYKKGGNKEKFVFERSGLNQGHAKGRKRNPNEVYIPVPADIHHKFPNFFPPIIEGNKTHFELNLPNGETYNASMCQEAKIKINGHLINKGKGLMTYSNKGLGEWLLRKALQLNENQLVTYEMLEKIGYDSVIIYKLNNNEYKIDVLKVNSYEDFKANILE
jgi:hypothetical protein